MKFDLDGLVVIGRVDSSTNACLLAENLGSSDREMPRSRGLIDKVIFRENDPLVILLERTVTVMVLCPNIQTKAQSEIDAPWSSKALLNITFKGTLQEFSKETLQQNMNQLDPAYSLNADDENSYADPEEYSEDSDSDEDYNSF
ncbi:hypothetical protein VitviT2T_014841 [Vitis vinifera]|uniref:Uncharacterized protein n=1 Tax=Vitis vinifera TaxID=29760 RepID=A0ABY9CLL2_VITVI|nr:hypothetical protein VitviT2T_014841 [Vitis vinifera]